MSDSIKFTYNDETDTLLVHDNGKLKSYKMDTIHNQQDKIFRYIIKSVADLDGDEPIPTPSSDPSFVIKPVAGFMGTISSKVTSGTYFEMVKGDVYNVVYDGTLYENVEVCEITATVTTESEPYDTTALYIGNPGLALLRSEVAMAVSPETRDSVVETDHPFVLFITEVMPNMVITEGGLVQHEFTITKSNDSSSTYTLQETPTVYMSAYVPPVTEFVEALGGVEDNKAQDVIVDDTRYTGKWVSQGEGQYILSLDGYASEEEPVTTMLGIYGSQEMIAIIIENPIEHDVVVTYPIMSEV